MGLGMFWGATTQQTDWVASQLIYVDVTNALGLCYACALWRLCSVQARGPRAAARGQRHVNRAASDLLRAHLGDARWWR